MVSRKEELQDQLQELLVVQQQAHIIKYLNPSLIILPDRYNIKLISVSEENIREISLPTLGAGPIMYSSFSIAYNDEGANPILSNIIDANTHYYNSVAVYENNNTFQPFTNVPSIVDEYNNIDMTSTSTQGKVKIFDIMITYTSLSNYITARRPTPM